MYSFVVFLLAALIRSIAANPLGTKTVLEFIIPTPVGFNTSTSALQQSLPSLPVVTTSSSSPAVTVVSTPIPPPNDPAAGNLAAAIAAAFSSPGLVFNLSASAASEATATSLPPTTTKPLSITAISDTIANVPTTSSLSFSVLMTTVALGSVLSTTAQFAIGLSAIVPITSYPSQEPILPLPQLPAPPEASLSSLLNNGSISNISGTSTVPSSFSTLYLPTGVPAGNITTLPASVPSALPPTLSPTPDPVTFLKNVTAAMQVLEVLSTVLEGDSGDISAISIPEVGTSIGSNDELAELLRDMAVSLLT